MGLLTPPWWRRRRIAFRPGRLRIVLSGLLSVVGAALIIDFVQAQDNVPIWAWSLILPGVALSIAGVFMAMIRFGSAPVFEVSGNTFKGYGGIPPWREVESRALKTCDLSRIERAVTFERMNRRGKTVTGVRLERRAELVNEGELRGYDVPTDALPQDASVIARFLNYRIARTRAQTR